MITKATREEILRQARYRCCLHRIAWIDLVAHDAQASKWHPLEVHHVVFRSCGGSDDPANLVPLCPSCHTIIHTSRTLGGMNLDDDKLKALWALWQTFAVKVGSSLHIGDGPSAAKAVVRLGAYGLDVVASVDNAVSFVDARRSILDATVGVLGAIDPYFPFPRGPVEPAFWATSFDDILLPWNEHTAAEVFAQVNVPMTLMAPVIITLDRTPRPHLGGNDEQRTA